MPPAGRPANCEPAKRVAVGKEEQGSVRMASFLPQAEKDAGAKRTAPRPRRNGGPPRPPIGEECRPQGGLPTASQQSGSQLERRSKGACGWRLFCRRQKKDAGAKRTAPLVRKERGPPRDLRLEKNAARRAACQLRASKAGRSWKGGARERADGVFFAAGRKKAPEQSGLCSDVVPKVGLEPTRYRYQRILSPSRLPFHHFGISTKLSIP